jgi:ferrous iron transport protein A
MIFKNFALREAALMKLHELKAGQKARIRLIHAGSEQMDVKLRELGFSEGDEVEMVGAGPFGGRTLAVRLNRTLIALRTSEAALIEVDPT